MCFTQGQERHVLIRSGKHVQRELQWKCQGKAMNQTCMANVMANVKRRSLPQGQKGKEETREQNRAMRSDPATESSKQVCHESCPRQDLSLSCAHSIFRDVLAKVETEQIRH